MADSKPVKNEECDHSNWMTNLSMNQRDTPLTMLAIPGTHDSFSYKLTLDEIGPGPLQSYKLWVPWHVGLGAAKRLVKRFAVAQKCTFKEQLKLGIRYFDFRIAPKPNTTELYFVHSLFGDRVKGGLEDINTFLSDHPKEVVILDFNHLYDMGKSHHNDLKTIVEQVFGEKVCPCEDTTESTSQLNKLTLNGMQTRQVVILYDYMDLEHNVTKEELDAIKAEKWFWPCRTNILSPWPNTTDVKEMVKGLDKLEIQENRFYVSQGVLTPNARTIAWTIVWNWYGSLETLAKNAAPAVLTWLEEKRVGDDVVNIVIIDFADAAFVKAVLALNNTK